MKILVKLIVIFICVAYAGNSANDVHPKSYAISICKLGNEKSHNAEQPLIIDIRVKYILPRHYSYSLTTPHDSLVVVAPNIFTPNGDGVNDHWGIVIHDYGIAIMDLQAVVYDRWGKEIFKTTNIHQVWNGNNHIGKACEEGTYFFVVSYTNGASRETEVHKGFVQLLR
jgi:gliding motility-associated-like protein